MLDKIYALTYLINVKTFEDKNTEIGLFNFKTREIKVNPELNNILKLIVLAHEVGHACQCYDDFIAYIPSGVRTEEDELNFILAVERDAWEKGEFILRNFYSLTDEFWFEFYKHKNIFLSSYADIENYSGCLNLFYFNYKSGIEILPKRNKTFEGLILEISK